VKLRILTCITTIALFAALTVPVRPRVAAQQHGKGHSRYKLTDVGTLGGPNSGFCEIAVARAR